MDKRKLLLLKYLLENCIDGYKVLSTTQVLKCLKKYKNDFVVFEKDVEFLAQRKYIDLKYIDEDNLCVAIMDNSRILQENIKIERGNKKEMRTFLLFTSILSGIMAFIGSFLAIIILR